MRIALLSYIAALVLPTLAQLVGVSVNGILVNSTIPANVSSGFRAGAARVDITPPANKTWLPLGRYEHERLYVRAIVFESQDGQRGALIGSDLSNIEELVYQDAAARAAKLLNTSVEHIIISSTHTHGATLCGTALFWTSENYGYYEVPGAVEQAVTEALGKLETAYVGYGTGEAWHNVNRDSFDPVTQKWTEATNLTAPVDREVEVLTFVRSDRSPLASYTSYAMHPVKSYLLGYTSSDWSGAMARWIEKSFSDDHVAIYSQQASGDVNPRFMRTTTNYELSMTELNSEVAGYEIYHESVEVGFRNRVLPLVRADPSYTTQVFDEIQSLGIMVAEEVLRVMSQTTEYQTNPSIWGKQQNVTCPGRTRLDSGATNRAGSPGNYTTGPDVPIRFGVLGLGNLTIATVGAEIYTKIGWRIKELTPMGNNTMLVTMANGKAPSGYIPDTGSWSHLTFEVLGSKLQPGICAEDGIVGNITQLIAEYVNVSANNSVATISMGASFVEP